MRGVVCRVIQRVCAGQIALRTPRVLVEEKKIDETRNSYRSARRTGGRIGHRGGAGRHAEGRLGRRFSDFNRRDGNFDSAYAIGTGSSAGVGTGSGDTAIASGTDSTALAGGDTVTDASGTHVYLGNDDFSSAFGAHTLADTGAIMSETSSSDNIAMVFDPFGTLGSSAYAGDGNFDLAAVFADMLHATAEGGFMADILPML
jgi:hypothetical protein